MSTSKVVRGKVIDFPGTEHVTNTNDVRQYVGGAIGINQQGSHGVFSGLGGGRYSVLRVASS